MFFSDPLNMFNVEDEYRSEQKQPTTLEQLFDIDPQLTTWQDVVDYYTVDEKDQIRELLEQVNESDHCSKVVLTEILLTSDLTSQDFDTIIDDYNNRVDMAIYKFHNLNDRNKLWEVLQEFKPLSPEVVKNISYIGRENLREYLINLGAVLKNNKRKMFHLGMDGHVKLIEYEYDVNLDSQALNPNYLKGTYYHGLTKYLPENHESCELENYFLVMHQMNEYQCPLKAFEPEVLTFSDGINPALKELIPCSTYRGDIVIIKDSGGEYGLSVDVDISWDQFSQMVKKYNFSSNIMGHIFITQHYSIMGQEVDISDFLAQHPITSDPKNFRDRKHQIQHHIEDYVLHLGDLCTFSCRHSIKFYGNLDKLYIGSTHDDGNLDCLHIRIGNITGNTNIKQLEIDSIVI